MLRMLALAGSAATAGCSATALAPLRMQPLGAYCGGGPNALTSGLAGSPGGLPGNATNCGETTPVLWHGDLVMVEGHQNFRVRRQYFPATGTLDNDVLIDGVPASYSTAFVSH